jgi:DNA-binding transcriptional MerR regulator
MAQGLAMIRQLRAQGLSYQKIADAMNAQGLTGPQGGRWEKSRVIEAVKRYGMETKA